MNISYQRLNRISVSVLVILLLAVFAGTLADFYMSEPSPGISRDIFLVDVDPGRTSTSDRRVAVIPEPDGRAATVAAIDGSFLRILTINGSRDLVTDVRMPVGFGSSTHIRGYRDATGQLVLFHAGGDLIRLVYDPATGALTEELIARSVDAFEGAGGRLAVLKRDGLYLWSDVEGTLEGPVLQGEITRIEADDSGGRTTVAAVLREPGEVHRVVLLDFDDGLEVTRRQTVLEGNTDEQLRKLQDIRVTDDGAVSMLFLFRDNRFGFNYLNLRRFDRTDGTELLALETDVPIVNSRYHLTGGGPDHEVVTMRYRTLYGDNLAECRLSAGGEPVIRPLTKSRDMTIEAGAVSLGGHDVLVFTDYSKEGARIGMASTHPDAIHRSTRWRGADWGMILGVTATHFLVALFASWVYLLIAVPPAAILLGVLQRFVRPELRYFYVLIGLGGIVYTVMKFFVTGYFLRSTDMSHLFFPGLAPGWSLNLALVAMSLVSYGLSAVSFSPIRKRQGSILEAFLRFAVTDSILYTSMFLIYGITAMLLIRM